MQAGLRQNIHVTLHFWAYAFLPFFLAVLLQGKKKKIIFLHRFHAMLWITLLLSCFSFVQENSCSDSSQSILWFWLRAHMKLGKTPLVSRFIFYGGKLTIFKKFFNFFFKFWVLLDEFRSKMFDEINGIRSDYIDREWERGGRHGLT